jgi:hypothetical protein
MGGKRTSAESRLSRKKAKRCTCGRAQIHDEGQAPCCRWRFPPLAPCNRFSSSFPIGVRSLESRREVAVALVARVRAQRKQRTRTALTRKKGKSQTKWDSRFFRRYDDVPVTRTLRFAVPSCICVARVTIAVGIRLGETKREQRGRRLLRRGSVAKRFITFLLLVERLWHPRPTPATEGSNRTVGAIGGNFSHREFSLSPYQEWLTVADISMDK